MSKGTHIPLIRSLSIGILTFIISIAMSPISFAINVDDPTSGKDQPIKADNLPGGSFRQTCYPVRGWVTTWPQKGYKSAWDQPWLHAYCKTMSGTTRETILYDFDYCKVGSITNIDGKLFCTRKETPVPPGSWSQTCVDAYVRESSKDLVALCRKKNGEWNSTSLWLVIQPCDIINDNGALNCALPGGSYAQSCRNIVYIWDLAQLQASCRDVNGNYQTSRVNLPCARPISNLNGHLFCGGWAELLGGSWQQSCQNMSWDGKDILSTQCRTKSGNWRNNTINLAQCRSRQAWNNDGYLTCEGGAAHLKPSVTYPIKKKLAQ